MTRLPRELAPWAPFLEAFPDEAVRTIWPWIPRLNTLLGPVQVDSDRRSGETDGFDGLTRRGLYDRLVTGEWALLELLPDEFIRRAAMNEQLYLKPARKSPQEAKRSVMLFDAGPDQLGAPRLAHLALLMIMARRARISRTSFAWGILQDPPGLQEEFSAEQLARLVGARTWHAPGPGHIERWKEGLACLQPEDLWIVGSPGLAQLSHLHHASTIVVDEPLEIPATHLSVSVARPGNAPHKKVRLDLPARDAAVRLLRASAYRKTAARPVEPSVSEAIQISWHGHRLFARGPNATLFAYHVPNSSSEPQGRTRYLNPLPSESLLAASAEARKWSWVTLSEDRMICRGFDAFKPSAGVEAIFTEVSLQGLPSGDAVVAPPADACVSTLTPGCAVKIGEEIYRCVVFTDGRRALFGICGNKLVLYKAQVSFSVDNTETHGRSLLMMENPPGGPRRLVHALHGEITDHPFDLNGGGTFAMVNRTTSVTDRTFGVNDVGRRWRFCRLSGNKAIVRFDLWQLAGSRVIGWIPPDGPYGEKNAGLVCWTEEPGLVMSVSEKRESVLFNAFKPIRACLYHPGRGLIALSTDDELIVHSIWEGRPLARIPRSQA